MSGSACSPASASRSPRAALQGAAAITLKGNQLIAGVAINMLAAGLTTFLGIQWFAQGGRTPQLTAGERFAEIELPFADELRGRAGARPDLCRADLGP